MSRKTTIGVSSALGFGLVAGVIALLALVAFPGKGQSLAVATPGTVYRISSAWFDGEVSAYDETITVYDKTFRIPNTIKTLYVEITATGDEHGEQLELNCRLNGSNCMPDGFEKFLNTDGNDWHDNSIVARWCVHPRAQPGLTSEHNVEIEMRSDGGDYVFMEHGVITVDGETSSTACEQLDAGGEGAATTGHGG